MGQLLLKFLFSNLQKVVFLIILLKSLKVISLISKLSIIFWILSSHSFLYFSGEISHFLHVRNQGFLSILKIFRFWSFQQCLAEYILFSLFNSHFGFSFSIFTPNFAPNFTPNLTRPCFLKPNLLEFYKIHLKLLLGKFYLLQMSFLHFSNDNKLW